MSRDLKTYNLLLDYLSGKLGEEEKLALEKLWADPDKRAELLETGAIEHGGDAYYKQKFDDLHQQMKVVQSRRTRFIWMAGAAAAAVILVFWLFNFLGEGNEKLSIETLYADNIPSPTLVARGDGMSFCMNPPLEAEKIIKELAGKPKLENTCNRLLGVTYYNLKEYKKSSEALAKVDADAIFLDETLWYQSLSLFALKQYEETKRTIDSLINLEDTKKYTKTYIDKAKELKENLPALIEESESK